MKNVAILVADQSEGEEASVPEVERIAGLKSFPFSEDKDSSGTVACKLGEWHKKQ